MPSPGGIADGRNPRDGLLMARRRGRGLPIRLATAAAGGAAAGQAALLTCRAAPTYGRLLIFHSGTVVAVLALGAVLGMVLRARWTIEPRP
jgi:hypothetical protein